MGRYAWLALALFVFLFLASREDSSTLRRKPSFPLVLPRVDRKPMAYSCARAHVTHRSLNSWNKAIASTQSISRRGKGRCATLCATLTLQQTQPAHSCVRMQRCTKQQQRNGMPSWQKQSMPPLAMKVCIMHSICPCPTPACPTTPRLPVVRMTHRRSSVKKVP